jgi:hypothetical protein
MVERPLSTLPWDRAILFNLGLESKVPFPQRNGADGGGTAKLAFCAIFDAVSGGSCPSGTRPA